MKKVLLYAAVGLALALLLAIDALEKADLWLNSSVLAVVGGLLIVPNLNHAFGLRSWFPKKHKGEKSVGADIVLMEARLRRAASGRQSSRGDVANLLVSAYAMRNSSSPRPDHDSVMRAKRTLVSKAGGDGAIAEIFDPGLADRPHRILGSGRARMFYLNSVEAALGLVESG